MLARRTLGCVCPFWRHLWDCHWWVVSCWCCRSGVLVAEVGIAAWLIRRYFRLCVGACALLRSLLLAGCLSLLLPYADWVPATAGRVLKWVMEVAGCTACVSAHVSCISCTCLDIFCCECSCAVRSGCQLPLWVQLLHAAGIAVQWMMGGPMVAGLESTL